MTQSYPVRVPRDYWATRVAPEGILERWRRGDGQMVQKDAPVAEVTIEGDLREVLAPAAGRLSISAGPNSVVEPDGVIGEING